MATVAPPPPLEDQEDVAGSLLNAIQQSGPRPAAVAHPLSNPNSPEFRTKAAKYQLDPDEMGRLMQHESGFDPRAVSKKGAEGLFQLMKPTQRQYGVTDPFDPEQNVDAGFRYYRDLLKQYGGDKVKALAAWNAGPRAVEQYGGVPPYQETHGLIRKVYGAEALQQADTETVGTSLLRAVRRPMAPSGPGIVRRGQEPGAAVPATPGAPPAPPAGEPPPATGPAPAPSRPPDEFAFLQIPWENPPPGTSFAPALDVAHGVLQSMGTMAHQAKNLGMLWRKVSSALGPETQGALNEDEIPTKLEQVASQMEEAVRVNPELLQDRNRFDQVLFRAMGVALPQVAQLYLLGPLSRLMSMTGALVTTTALTAADQGILETAWASAKALALGKIMGRLGGLPASVRIPGTAVTFALPTWLQTHDPKETAAQAMIGGALAIPGGGQRQGAPATPAPTPAPAPAPPETPLPPVPEAGGAPANVPYPGPPMRRPGSLPVPERPPARPPTPGVPPATPEPVGEPMPPPPFVRRAQQAGVVDEIAAMTQAGQSREAIAARLVETQRLPDMTPEGVTVVVDDVQRWLSGGGAARPGEAPRTAPPATPSEAARTARNGFSLGETVEQVATALERGPLKMDPLSARATAEQVWADLHPGETTARTVPPETPGTPPTPPDLRAATQQEVAARLPNVQSYLQEHIADHVMQARRFGIEGTIEQWAADGLTLDQMANRLRQEQRVGALNRVDTRELVTSLRAFLGIPSQQMRSEFQAWRKNYHAAREREAMVEKATHLPPQTPEEAALEQQMLGEMEQPGTPETTPPQAAETPTVHPSIPQAPAQSPETPQERTSAPQPTPAPVRPRPPQAPGPTPEQRTWAYQRPTPAPGEALPVTIAPAPGAFGERPQTPVPFPFPPAGGAIAPMPPAPYQEPAPPDVVPGAPPTTAEGVQAQPYIRGQARRDLGQLQDDLRVFLHDVNVGGIDPSGPRTLARAAQGLRARLMDALRTYDASPDPEVQAQLPTLRAHVRRIDDAMERIATLPASRPRTTPPGYTPDPAWEAAMLQRYPSLSRVPQEAFGPGVAVPTPVAPAPPPVPAPVPAPSPPVETPPAAAPVVAPAPPVPPTPTIPVPTPPTEAVYGPQTPAPGALAPAAMLDVVRPYHAGTTPGGRAGAREALQAQGMPADAAFRAVDEAYRQLGKGAAPAVTPPAPPTPVPAVPVVPASQPDARGKVDGSGPYTSEETAKFALEHRNGVSPDTHEVQETSPDHYEILPKGSAVPPATETPAEVKTPVPKRGRQRKPSPEPPVPPHVLAEYAWRGAPPAPMPVPVQPPVAVPVVSSPAVTLEEPSPAPVFTAEQAAREGLQDAAAREKVAQEAYTTALTAQQLAQTTAHSILTAHDMQSLEQRVVEARTALEEATTWRVATEKAMAAVEDGSPPPASPPLPAPGEQTSPAEALEPAAPPPEPAPPPTRRSKRQRARQAREALLAEYFTPGTIVKSYGGYDRVIAYDPASPAQGRFTVQVQAVDPSTGEPLSEGGIPARPRTHRTPPNEREMRQMLAARAEGRLWAPGGTIPFPPSMHNTILAEALGTAQAEE